MFNLSTCFCSLAVLSYIIFFNLFLTMAPILNRMSSVGDAYSRVVAQSPVKEMFAECFGTFILVVLGDSVMANCVLGRLGFNSLVAGAFGWGLAVMIAVAVTGGVSGGHVNPAVTTGFATVRKCPVRLVAFYVLAQYIGSFLAAAVVYWIYIDSIAFYDGGVRQIAPSANSTAEIFATYPQDFASSATCFFDQVVASAILLIIICAATDAKNLRIPPYAQPMMIGLGVTAIIFAFGQNCGSPLNPARDLAPRIFTAVSGWGKGVFSYRNYEWFWIPVLAPHVGGIVGVWLYKLLIEMPSEFQSGTMHNGDDCCFPDGERQLDGQVNSPNSVIDIPADDVVFKQAMDKAIHDIKLATDSSLPSNLISQNV